MILTYSKENIRKFLLEKQLLLEPRKITGYKGIERVFSKLGCIQYDPQNICGRSIDLTLQARVGNILISDYFNWLYKKNSGIEIFDKELCVVPYNELNNRRKYFSDSRKKRLGTFISENREKLDEILNYIKIIGPICSADLSENKKVEISWAPIRWNKFALDNLWKNGELVIDYRKGNRKFFNLPQKKYGDSYSFETNNNLNRMHIKKRIESVGLLPRSGTGGGWLGIGLGKEISILISKMITDNELIEIKIDGIKDIYVINSEDYLLIEKIKDKKNKKKCLFSLHWIISFGTGI